MMKLSTMKKVMDTVDGEWKSPLGEKILEHWGYDKGSVSFVRASANFIFEFTREGKPYFLRFNESSERDFSSIKSELRIVKYLRNRIKNVVQPINSLNGNDMEVVETEIGTFYAVVFEALEGKHYELDEISNEQAYLWGKSLGILHETLKQLPKDFRMDRPSWKDLLVKTKETLPKNELAAHREIDRLWTWADELCVSKENYGMIHYDFELDNVLFDNNTIRMLDFDDSSVHWYVADIVYAWRDAGSFNLENPATKIFIEGYKSETSLDEEVLQAYSSFERLHHLTSLAKLIRAVDIGESEDHPEWLADLRVKLCSITEKYRLSIEKFDK
ncbi:Ser/Thr protein kinase RdoA involved in Cpx stress response, MazF antagonist [Oceanobacillus limi]|uniref:Ser/Thr protein kinase RdoA involved in Cpx stress response, MazF antagonist n=1 Tax=Oceanobacillus limi TaxID=930131 RepID=A0A1H9Y527_9BACI|nr:phosphotransferase [Oceanobacillus limi]SES63893.1 Ser/Thr protein kinase RdoA involved in Cpx stress response, MazF antagonist [Oceanobacillus limi]